MRSTRAVIALLGCLAMLCPDAGAGPNRYYNSTFFSREVDVYDHENVQEFIHPDDARLARHLLRLDADQSQAWEDLYAEYWTRIQHASRALETYRSQFRAWKQDNPGAVISTQDDVDARFSSFRAALYERFLADLRALLTPAQAALWPTLERQLERRTLREELSAVAAELDVAALLAAAVGERIIEPELMDALDRGIADSRRLLAVAGDRRKDVRALTVKHGESWASAPGAAEAIRAYFDAERAIAAHNIDWIDSIVRRLPPRESRRFVRQACTQAYMGAYEIQIAGADDVASWQWVEDQKDLSADQNTALDELAVAITRETLSIHRKLIEQKQAKEDQSMAIWRPGDPMPLMSITWPEPTATDAIADLRFRAIERLRAILTPEQLARAPRPLDDSLPPLPEFDPPIPQPTPQDASR